MATFSTDAWIIFSEEEVPLDKVARAEEIAHELGANETVHYSELRVKYEGYDQAAVEPYAAAILSRLNGTQEPAATTRVRPICDTCGHPEGYCGQCS